MYIQRKGSGMMGFGDTAGMCRTGVPFWKDGNWWVPIRDASGKEYPLMQTPELAALAMCSAAAGGGTSWWQSLIGGATDVLKAKVTAAPVTNITTAAPAAGMSTTTKLMIGGGVLVAAALIWKSRK